jgi:small-conductance mechanosensitive channel
LQQIAPNFISGINILVEFWMEGVDDGEHLVGGDLLLMFWQALKANGIVIPFPQRVVRVTGDSTKTLAKVGSPPGDKDDRAPGYKDGSSSGL